MATLTLTLTMATLTLTLTDLTLTLSDLTLALTLTLTLALEQAIVGAAGDLDSPLTSQAKGFRALTQHLTGVTDEMRQRYATR